MATASPRPEEFARALLSRLNIRQPVDMADLAHAIGLRLREVRSTGFDGALVRVPGRMRGIVAIRDGIREKGRKRFTIAHEIGHYILPGHGMVSPVCKGDQIEALAEGTPNQEWAANRFASELLLPSDQIGPVVKQRGASILTAKFISDKFETSLTAAALKCVELTEDSCALVVSVGGIVSRFRPNRLWRYVIPLGCALGPGTLAKYLSEEANGREKSGMIPAAAWAWTKNMLPDAYVVEDSVLLSRYNITLSILTAIGP